MTPGTSTLFVMTFDRVRDAFAGQNAELIFTNLSNEQGDAIREVFAAAD